MDSSARIGHSLRLRGAAAVAAAAMAVAACGSSTGSGSGSGSSGGDIHIAMVGPYSGTFSALGQAMWEGSKAAEAAVNASGGIMGRKLVMDLVDTIGDPADAVPAVDKEIITNHPAGVIGPQGNEIGATAPIFDKNKIPFMFQGGSTVYDNTTDPYLWRSNPSDSQLGVAMAAWALKQGYKNCAFTFSTANSVQTLGKVVEDAFTKNGGTIAADVPLTPLQPSYRSEILKVVNAHPDCVFLQTEAGSAAAYFNDFRQLNFQSVPFIGSDLTSGSDFIQAVTPGFASQHLISAVGSSAPGPGGDTFNKYYSQLYSHAPLSGANYAYDGVMSLALAMDQANSTAGSDIVKAIPLTSHGTKTVTTYADGVAALKSGTSIAYRGASGPINYNQYHNVYGPFDMVQAKADGTLGTIYTFSAIQLQSVTDGKGLGG
jgi:branched-chain amino acid transport system substrate-binding protein